MNNLKNEVFPTVKTKKKKKRRRKRRRRRAEINEMDKKKNQKQSWFFEKMKKFGKPMANLNKVRGEKTQISKIRNKIGKITNTKEIQRIIRD
jgi:hypothetical protein